jgi:putative membrane protein
MKVSYLFAAPVALLAAVPAMAQVMTPADYVKTASASDLYERQSAQIVLQTTASPDVRAFAEMMMSAHAQSTADVKAAAMKSKVAAAPPMLSPLQAEIIAQLRDETSDSRDAVYIAQQKAAHNQALNVQQAYAMDGTVPTLKAAAARIVPIVQSHIAMLMKM